MPEHSAQPVGPFRQIWARFKRNWIISEIPQEVALCEFDCRKGQCSQEEWAACKRRISRAAGELMPGPPASL
jgi:hypothetical protein